MQLLEKYIQELEQDVRLDELNLKESALMLPARKAKWVSRLMLEKHSLNVLKEQKTNLIKQAVEEIKKDSGIKLPQPTLVKAAENHTSMSSINERITAQETLVEFLEKVEKSIHSIGFDIKNLIDLIKMETT